MTIQEKVGQLRLISVGGNQTLSETLDQIEAGEIGGIFNTIVESGLLQMQDRALKSPNKIPLVLGFDIAHGHRTIFLINLDIAANWDRNAIAKVAEISADEATSDGLNITWATMVDITRDPRWGRVSEGFGEDPYLTSEAGRIFAEKMQKSSLADNKSLVSSVKHFALYGAVEGVREYDSTDMSERKMLQEYLVSYKAAIDAGSRVVMVSLVSVNDIPATANHWLLTEILRDKWHFDGVASDPKNAVCVAINVGIDMSMNDEYFLQFLPELVKEGSVTEAKINQACRHVLELKYDMGLFNNPHRNLDPKLDINTMFADKRLHRQEARDIARRSIVLLKNSNKILLVSKNAKIAVIGPLADSKRDILGSWSGAGRIDLAVTPLEGIKNAVKYLKLVRYAFGANPSNDANLYCFLNLYSQTTKFDNISAYKMIDEAVSQAQKVDVVVVFVGEAEGMTHESSSRTYLSLPTNQKQLIKALKTTGKPLVIALMNGRPLLTLTEEYALADAMLETWFLGTEGGNAIADVLFGDYNPSGKLTMSFPDNIGQLTVYYSHLNTGRPRDTANMGKYTSSYFDSPNESLFPFGCGLSYTNFIIDFSLSNTEMTQNSEIIVTANIENI